MDYTEINKAIEYGKAAYQSLLEAYKFLDDASDWGLFDIFGGGLFTDFMKHSYINYARNMIDCAKNNLLKFEEELEVIDIIPDLEIDIDGVFVFFDFVDDSLLANVLVESKINDAKNRIDEVADLVKNTLHRLENL